MIFKNTTLGARLGAREMAQSVKYLGCKHEDLSLPPELVKKNLGMMAHL